MSVSRISDKIGETLGPLVDILYPRICLICTEREAINAPLICSKCWKKLLRQIRHNGSDQMKTSKSRRPDFWTKRKFRTGSLPIISLAGFVDPLAEMIRLFKFQGYVRLGQRLGRLLARRKSAEIHALSPNWLAATPLHFADFRRRGFNQAEILSDILSRACGVAPAGKLIAKPVRTKHQSLLQAEERAYNLAGAFETLLPEFEGAKVVLVDDVITTGSTIREIGRTLSEAGAEIVGAVALASEIRTFTLDENEEIDDSDNTDNENYIPF